MKNSHNYETINPFSFPKLTACEKSTTMKKMNLDSLSAKEYIIERLEVTPGNLVLMCATGCSGKTMLAQYIAMCIDGNKPLFGQFPVKHGKVVHIDQEQSLRQTQIRYIRLSNGLNVDEYNIERVSLKYRLDDDNLKPEDVEQELVNLCTDKVLLIVDSLKASSVVDENSAEIEKVLKMFKRVAEKTQCAVLCVHHKGKGKDAKQSGRGHSSIYDSCDVQFDLEVNNEIYEISCAKNREGKYFDGIKYTLLDTGDYVPTQHCTQNLEFSILQSDVKSSKQSQKEKIIQSLTDNDQLKSNDLFDAVKGDKAKFHEVLVAMVDAREVNEVAGPRNSKLYSLTEEFKSAQAWK